MLNAGLGIRVYPGKAGLSAPGDNLIVFDAVFMRCIEELDD